MKLTRLQIGVMVLVVAAIGAYWYFSPNIVLYRLQQAALKADSDAVNDHIDYPALRESIRGQMAAAMTDKLGELKDNPFAALGGMMAMAMVNQMVDAMVRPEVMANAMATGRMKRAEAAGADQATNPDPAQRVRWSIERKSLDKIIAHPKDDAGKVDPTLPAFVFERRGFADWKLTEVRMLIPK